MVKRLVVVCAALFAVLYIAGCNSNVPTDDTQPVARASDDPTEGFDGGAGNGFDGKAGGTDGQWQDNANENSVDNADKDGWVPALDANGNPLKFPTIYFAYDSDTLVPSETANLDRISDYMKKHGELGVVIEGHCDQRGTDEYNRALGERRANAIRAYLSGVGINDARMKTVSFGKDKPAVDGQGESIWRQNRRGEPLPMVMPQMQD
ncbi:MAG: OmpA family protein [Victivallaceae bacterium]|nr:OmpA family protein [Victivallaceae bacterium]